MPIDIRATVTCTLGTLISGSISDDYLQGSGLVKTKGTCEISGLITPAMGTAVTFSYTKGGVTRTIPRKLRVLSSFADPFRRTTKVELGCKLTYLSDLQEPVKWKAFDDAENSEYDEDDTRIITLPIHAASVMSKCLAELGIGASSSPLTNKFSVAEFDFGAGYVQVLNDLLVSESYFGYLDTSEVLQVRNLSVVGGTGPVFTSADIVDVGSIGVGQLPGEAVTVSYSTLKLKEPEEVDEEDEEAVEEQEKEEELLNWEREEVIGAKTIITAQYVNPLFPDTKQYNTWTYTPRTVVQTTYDEWDRVVSRVSTSYTIGAAINTQYFVDSWTASTEQSVNIGVYEISEQQIVDTETIEYVLPAQGERPETGYEDVKSNTQVKTEPQMAIAGAIAASFLEDDGTLVNYMPLFGNTITEKIITTYETQSAYINGISTPITKTIITKFKAYGYTQSGQQETAKQLDAGTTTNQAIFNAMKLVPDGVDVIINSGRGVGLQERPRTADRTNAKYADGGDPNNGWRTESSSEQELAVGSATAQRRIELSLPYAPDDTFSGPSGGPYIAVPSDAPSKASRYGRVQNRLLLGNRSGINIQVAPERLPAAPFSPLYIQANGLTALYRANANQWAFDSNGIVCSTDALFWGAVGGTGTFWFPVAPGITTLPTTPAIVDGEMNATSVVLPYNETSIYEGRLRVGATITSIGYALDLLTEIDPIELRLGAVVRVVTLVTAPSVGIAVAPSVPTVSTGAAVQPPIATISIAGAAPAVSSGASVQVGSALVEVAPALGPAVPRPATFVFAPEAPITVAGETTVVVSGASVAIPAANISIAAAAPIQVGYFDPSFSSVSLLLHMDGSNGSTTFTDNSSNTFTVTANGNAQISTAQSKFGGASALFDGAGDYLDVGANSAFSYGTGDFTVEFWYRCSSAPVTVFRRILAHPSSTNAANTFQIWHAATTTSGATVDAVELAAPTGTSIVVSVKTAVSDSTWHHIAFTRQSGTSRAFLDGVLKDTASDTNNYTRGGTEGVRISSRGDLAANTFINGYVDDLRITKGVARYTATFTVPPQAFPDK